MQKYFYFKQKFQFICKIITKQICIIKMLLNIYKKLILLKQKNTS